MSKPEARSYSAATTSEKAAGPLAWGDKCFLCSNVIGESDPRGFYTGKNNNAMMIGHRGCLDALDAVGGDPIELHKLWASKSINQSNEVKAAAEEATSVNSPGVSNIKFATFADMQVFISQRGPIPENVGVYIGEQKFQ